MSAEVIARVALDVPLRRTFDYLVPAAPLPEPGTRVRVPFGRTKRIGLVLETGPASAIEPAKLRRIDACLDVQPLLPLVILDLIRWSATYYQHPIGEVMAVALPASLRRIHATRPAPAVAWRCTVAGAQVELVGMARRAPQQAAVLACARRHGGRIDAELLATLPFDWRPVVRRLLARGTLAEEDADPSPCPGEDCALESGPVLTAQQTAAIGAICSVMGQFRALVLEGVTGSGKTEVYLHAARAAAQRGTQTLVLVPEIGLTDQVVARFRARFGKARVVVLHSGLSPARRQHAWLAARDGDADVVIGTRSAVWTPLARPGLLIVDEEHDLAYKQQEGMRYHARDLAVWRAQRESIPIVLGSATPALETLYNVDAGRYASLTLASRIGVAQLPRIQILDTRGRPLDAGLAPPMLLAIERHLAEGGQVLLFINRRGYAPVAICTGCGESLRCPRCNTHYVYHRSTNDLRCHHCGGVRPFAPACPRCAQPLTTVGQGTERIEERLRTRFPRHTVTRIDRDTTRAKGALARHLEAARSGAARILVGTQMLSKGHDFPNVSLVGVIDTDGRLYSADFRAPERLAQLLVQVSGRAGRAGRPGEVLIQSLFPEHPLLTALFARGYADYARSLLVERRNAGLPPFRAFALLRAQAKTAARAHALLDSARAIAGGSATAGVRVLGPVPAPMPLRAGAHRAQLLFEAARRSELGVLLARVLPALEREPSARWVRWSIDVDPQELL